MGFILGENRWLKHAATWRPSNSSSRWKGGGCQASQGENRGLSFRRSSHFSVCLIEEKPWQFFVSPKRRSSDKNWLFEALVKHASQAVTSLEIRRETFLCSIDDEAEIRAELAALVPTLELIATIIWAGTAPFSGSTCWASGCRTAACGSRRPGSPCSRRR